MLTKPLICWALASGAILIGLCSSAQQGHSLPKDLQEGDIIFQSSRSGQSEAIALATGSPWTHVGLLLRENEAWLVLEAIGPVRVIALEEWIKQGEGGRYSVKRSDPKHGKLDASAREGMRRVGERLMGKPYDTLFLWNDERIYCSELIWKIYAEGAGIQLCPAQLLREFALEHPVVRKTLQERYGEDPPWNEPIVAPSSLYDCPKLVTVAESVRP